MGRHSPYKNLNKFLITERSLNYILRPVQVRKNKFPYSYTVENLGNDVTVTVDAAWTYANHLILDFIGHELFEREYRNVVEKRNTWKNNLSQSLLRNFEDLMDLKDFEIPPHLRPYTLKYDEIERLKAQNSDSQRIAELENQIGRQKLHEIEELARRWGSVKLFGVEFNRNKLAERYQKFFKGRRSEYLNELIKRTSEVRFSLEYPIQKPVINQYVHKEKTISKIIDKSFEIVKIENNKIFNCKIDNGKIRVAFDTFLGRAYAHNLLTLNTDWFEEDFLKLNGYASAIYRHFFVTRSGNKVHQLPIRNIVEFFDLLKNSNYPKVIEKAFEDIKNSGLIADYRFKNNGGKFSKGYVEVDKSSK